MADRKYYVLCEQNCKFESMTKEQILTAIMNAVNEGEIGDIDAGFITTVKTINGHSLKFFIGTQAEYEALSAEEKKDLLKIITNDTTIESIEAAITQLQENHDELCDGLRDGSFVPKKAETARLNLESPKSCTYTFGAQTSMLPKNFLKWNTLYMVVCELAGEDIVSTCVAHLFMPPKPTSENALKANANKYYSSVMRVCADGADYDMYVQAAVIKEALLNNGEEFFKVDLFSDSASTITSGDTWNIKFYEMTHFDD